MKWADFWHRFTKAKSYFNNSWVGMVKNGWGVIDHGALISGVSHKWFDEMSRLIEWLLQWWPNNLIKKKNIKF